MTFCSIFQWFLHRFGVRNRCKMKSEIGSEMKSELKGFTIVQRPPEDAPRRHKSPQGLQVGADLVPREVPKSIWNRSKFDLGRPRGLQSHPGASQDSKSNENRSQIESDWFIIDANLERTRFMKSIYFQKMKPPFGFEKEPTTRLTAPRHRTYD